MKLLVSPSCQTVTFLTHNLSNTIKSILIKSYQILSNLFLSFIKSHYMIQSYLSARVSIVAPSKKFELRWRSIGRALFRRQSSCTALLSQFRGWINCSSASNRNSSSNNSYSNRSTPPWPLISYQNERKSGEEKEEEEEEEESMVQSISFIIRPNTINEWY